MNKIVFGIVIASAIVISCEYKDISPPCYHGKVIMSSCCTGSTFISMDSSTPIGKDTKLNGQDYSNVIQVPGYLSNSDGSIYMNLRKFNPDKDYHLFPIHCYCLVAVGM